MTRRLLPYRASLALAVAACLVLLVAAGARLLAMGTTSVGGTTLVIPVLVDDRAKVMEMFTRRKTSSLARQ